MKWAKMGLMASGITILIMAACLISVAQAAMDLVGDYSIVYTVIGMVLFGIIAIIGSVIIKNENTNNYSETSQISQSSIKPSVTPIAIGKVISMSEETTSQLLQKVQEALRSGDKNTAGMLMHQILAIDFTNPQVWKILHDMLGKDMPLENFKLQFAQKYYSNKAHLLVQPQTTEIPATPIVNTQEKLPSNKKCPYCAEEILAEAIICRFCGRNVNKESPQIMNEKQKKIDLNYELGEYEKRIITEEMSLQKWQQISEEKSKAVSSAIVWLIIGLFLIIAIVGIFIAFFAADQYIRNNREYHKANEQLTLIRKNIEQLRQRISTIRTELAILG